MWHFILDLALIWAWYPFLVTLFRFTRQFTPVLALYDPFGVDVPLNFDIIIMFKNGNTGTYI